jgi:hypothetical protein
LIVGDHRAQRGKLLRSWLALLRLLPQVEQPRFQVSHVALHAGNLWHAKHQRLRAGEEDVGLGESLIHQRQNLRLGGRGAQDG